MIGKKYSLTTYLTIVLIVVVVGSLVSYEGHSILEMVRGESPEVTLQKAELLNKEQKYSEALDLLLAASHKNPSNDDIKSLLKKTLVMHLEKQILDGYARLDSDKHDIEAYLQVARAFSLFSEKFRAMEVLTLGTMENPNSALLWLNLGLLELDVGRDAEAYAVFHEVIKLDASNAHAYNDLAFIESRTDDRRLQNLPKALINAKKAVSLAPDNPNFIDTLAEVEFRRGQPMEAVRLIKKAIDLAPEEPFYQKQLSRFEKGGTVVTGTND